MKIIMFAGGTGKRFWPTSRRKDPKQFQNLIDNKPLIRLKYDYLSRGFEPEDIFMSTGKAYEKEARSILPELPEENFIFEPEMRDSGPAVALAVAYVQSLYPEEVVSTQWSDHYIRDPDLFIKALQSADELVKNENRAVIVGIPPRFPSPHRGYIRFGRKLRSLNGPKSLILAEFQRFVEKPTLEVAKEFIASGEYSWNPGYFCDTPERILAKYEAFAPAIYAVIKEIADSGFDKRVLEKFGSIEKIAFDYIYAENLGPNEAYVINADMGWSDIGEWISLKEAQEQSPADIVTKGDTYDIGSTDSLIYNYENNKLIATFDLEGMVVVNTSDVLAVFPKESNDKIKDFLEKLEKDGKDKYL